MAKISYLIFLAYFIQNFFAIVAIGNVAYVVA